VDGGRVRWRLGRRFEGLGFSVVEADWGR
jgi:hypothetical protein